MSLLLKLHRPSVLLKKSRVLLFNCFSQSTVNYKKNGQLLINNNNRLFSSSLFRYNSDRTDNLDIKPAEELYNLALAEYRQNNFEKALEYLYKADQIEPNNPGIIYHIANILEVNGNFQEGVDEYNRFIEIYESLVEDEHREYYKETIVKCWLGAGNCIKSMNRFEEAVQYYSKVLEFTSIPLHSLGYYNRASCYYHLKNFREAIDDFTKMIESLIHQEVLNLNQMKMVASSVSNLDPSVCYYFKAICHANLGEFEQAIKDMTLIINDFEQKELSQIIKNNAMQNDEVRFHAYYTRAECYLRSDDLEHCLEDTTTVIGIMETTDPSDTELLSNLFLTKADLCFEMKKLDIALENCLKSIELNPSNSRAFFTAALLYKLDKNDEMALAFLKKVLELEPNNDQAKEILKEWSK